MIGRIKCQTCSREFLCKLTNKYGTELNDVDLERRHKDGEVCSHVMDGDAFEIIETEYDE